MRTEEGPERALGASPLNRRGGRSGQRGLGRGAYAEGQGPWELFGAAGCAMRERGQSEDRPFQERPYNGLESRQQRAPPYQAGRWAKGRVRPSVG